MTTSDMTSPPERDWSATDRSIGIALFEGALLILGLAALETTGWFAISTLPVHPYLFVVLVLAAQYGIYGGVLSSIGAGLVSLFHLWSGAGFVVLDAETLWPVWQNIVVWLASGLAVGVLTTLKVRELEKTRTALQRANISMQLISEHYQVLTERTHALERRLMATRQQTEPAPPPIEIAPLPQPEPEIPPRRTSRRKTVKAASTR